MQHSRSPPERSLLLNAFKVWCVVCFANLASVRTLSSNSSWSFFKTSKQLRLVRQPLMIFPHCITGLSASNRQINGHSRGLRTFSKGYGCSSTSLTNAITLRFRSCSWTCDQRDLWWIITAFMMMSLDSLLLASWWSTVFEEHSFLSEQCSFMLSQQT